MGGFLHIVQSDGSGAVLVVEGENQLVIVQVDGVHKCVEQHFAVGLLAHIQLTEFMQPEGDELRADSGPHNLLIGDLDLQILFGSFQLLKSALGGLGEDALHQKAGYMSELVESLFELTKVSSGIIEAKKEEIDLIRLLEQTTGLFDDQLTNAGLSVRRSYASDSIPVVTDGARMHQVFANLLGNAIKYALTGTRIYLEVKETERSYLIRMMNTASYEMDFKPDEIMQRFARGDKARSTKGSGLGLAIAQTYTESVGGKFHVAVDGDQFSAIVELPKTERNL